MGSPANELRASIKINLFLSLHQGLVKAGLPMANAGAALRAGFCGGYLIFGDKAIKSVKSKYLPTFGLHLHKPWLRKASDHRNPVQGEAIRRNLWQISNASCRDRDTVRYARR